MEVMRVGVPGIATGTTGVGLSPLGSAFSAATVSGAAAAAKSLEPTIHFDLSLYDGSGKQVSAFSPAALPPALRQHTAAGATEITVQTTDGTQVTIVKKADGSVSVSGAAGTSLEATAGSHADALLALAEQLAGKSDLASTAESVVSQALGTGIAGTIVIASGSTVTQVTVQGGAISAARTSASTPLETAIVDGSVVLRSVRNADGTGQSSVAGLTVAEQGDGSAAVAFDPSAASTSGAIATVGAVDALGDQVTISAATGVSLANASGTTYTLATNLAPPAPTSTSTTVGSATTTLSVDVALGGGSAVRSVKIDDRTDDGSQHQHSSIDAQALDAGAASIDLTIAADATQTTKSNQGATQTSTTGAVDQTLAARGDLSVAIESDEQTASQHDQESKTVQTSGDALRQLLAIRTTSTALDVRNAKGALLASSVSGAGTIDLAA